jgi:putative FmdB family regulatory protein
MAIYEYFCPQCRKVFEEMRPMSKADEPAFCPKCGSKGEKLLSVFASTADSSIKVPDKGPFRKTPKKTRH